MNSKIASILAFGIAVIGLFILIENHFLFSSNPITIAIQVLAAGLMIWSRITFGMRSFHGAANTTEGKLVTNGPYKYWRHPIYASVMYFIWASVIAYPFGLTIAVACGVTVALLTRALLEEKFLYKAYPEYEEYAKRTKRIIPFVF